MDVWLQLLTSAAQDEVDDETVGDGPHALLDGDD